jgi:hypothetical protein
VTEALSKWGGVKASIQMADVCQQGDAVAAVLERRKTELAAMTFQHPDPHRAAVTRTGEEFQSAWTKLISVCAKGEGVR